MKKLPFFLITLLGLSACQTDEPQDDTLTNEEAIAAIYDAADLLVEDVIDLIESDGLYSTMVAAEYVYFFSEYGDSFRQDDLKMRLKNLASVFVTKPAARVTTDDPVDDFPTGIFEWDDTKEDFVYAGESDFLILKFPMEGSLENNSILTISSVDFSSTGLPELLEVDLTVDGNLMMELYLAANWSQDEYPEDAEVYLYINPFGLSLGFNLTDGLAMTGTVSLSKDDEQIASVGISASNSIQNFINDVLPIIDGHVEYRGIKLDGTIDLAGMEEAYDNGTDPNEAMDIHLLVDGENVGKMILVLETDEGYSDYYPFIEFADGELVSVEDLLEDILIEIEAEFEDLEM